jgi:hypothetical protein
MHKKEDMIGKERERGVRRKGEGGERERERRGEGGRRGEEEGRDEKE